MRCFFLSFLGRALRGGRRLRLILFFFGGGVGGAEQLLLHLGFMETVKLHSIDFVAPADGESVML